MIGVMACGFDSESCNAITTSSFDVVTIKFSKSLSFG